MNTHKPAHLGAQNDAWFIILGEAPASSNDHPRHDADRTAIARVLDEAECRRLVACWNACKGISIADLEMDNVAFAEFFRSMHALKAHRDTLLSTRPETAAARDVLAERHRQISAEGWTPEHDDEHSKGQLAAAGGCYALFSDAYPNAKQCPAEWPWDAEWWKPTDYRRDLVKAGALILAEIERLDRAAAASIDPVDAASAAGVGSGA